MIQTTEAPSEVGAANDQTIALLNSCVTKTSTHEFLEQAEQKLKEAIALLRQAQKSIKGQGVESGWVESYPKNGRTLYNYGRRDGGKAKRKHLPEEDVSLKRQQIANGRRLKRLERKTENLSEFARSLKDGVL